MPRALFSEIMGSSAAPPTGAGPPSLESLLGSPTPEEGTLSKIFTRPGKAISEGFGALSTEQEPVLEAMWRGLWEGEQRYGSIGEQLIPDDPLDTPDVRMSKQAGRLALDWTTDPLMYIPASAVVKPAKFLAKPVAKASQILSKIPMPQIVARMTMPMTHVFKKYGSRWGARVGKKLKLAYEGHRLGAGRMEQDFIEKLGELGLKGNEGTPFRNAAMELLRGLPAETTYHTDPRTQQLYQWLRTALDNYATRIGGYKDPVGKQFKIIEPLLLQAKSNVQAKARKLKVMGKRWSQWRDEVWNAWETGSELPKWAPGKVQNAVGTRKAQALYKAIEAELGKINYTPKQIRGRTVNIFKKGFHQFTWQPLENYAPHILNASFAEELFKDRRGYHKAVTQFAKQLGVSEEKALDVLRNMALPKRSGNIEYARHLPWSSEMFETDPLVWFPKYVNKVEERIAYADQFGLDGDILNGLVKKIKQNTNMDKKWLRDARDIILGKYQSDRSVQEVARKIMGIQVMTKMGPLSSLANLSQNINTFIRDGGTAFTKGVLRAMTKPGKRQGYIAYQKGIQDELTKLAGGEISWATKYLENVGFNPVERLNRMLAANSGIVRAEQLARRALRAGGPGKLTTDLARRGVTEAELLEFATKGRFSEQTLEKIGFLASDATQHATHWKDLPIGWQDPFMRIMTQYKNFIYQQTRFIAREILRPAKEYIETQGHQGSLAPLMRAAVGFGIGAELTAFLRDQAKQATVKGVNTLTDWAGAGYVLEYEPREREDRWFVQLLGDSLNVGALGIAGDLVERASYRDLSSWMLGPTFGDITDFLEEAINAANVKSQGKDLPVSGWIQGAARRAPYVTGLVLSKSVKPLGERAETGIYELFRELGLK